MKFQIMAGASAAALLIAGSAFAQGATTTTYTPAVTQTTAADASSIDQIGTTNTANVTQSGGELGYNGNRENSSVVVQGGAAFAASAQNNTANVTQTGFAQRSLVMQATTASTTGAGGNAANGTAGNTANVTQSNYGQNAFGYQFGSNNATNIQQAGVAIDQYFNPNNPQGVNGASDTQTGINVAIAQRHTTFTAAENAAKSGQLGQGSYQEANVVQDWATNDLGNVTQSGTSASDSANISQAYQNVSTAKITQDGTGQAAWISQEGVATTGLNDTATVEQGAGAGSAIAVSYQLDATNSYSDVNQTGARSSAYTYQTGLADYSTVAQNDVGSTATVTQTGGNDVSDVTQSGGAGANTATVNQGLINAWSHVAQNGSGNTATVNQGTTAAFVSPR